MSSTSGCSASVALASTSRMCWETMFVHVIWDTNKQNKLKLIQSGDVTQFVTIRTLTILWFTNGK